MSRISAQRRECRGVTRLQFSFLAIAAILVGGAALSVPSAQVSVQRIRTSRPFSAGASISLATPKSPTGFVSCIVRDAKGKVYLLTAEGVLDGPVGADVIHPGWAHGGSDRTVGPRDVVARISRRLPGVGVIAELSIPASPRLGFLGRIAPPFATAVTRGEAVAVFGEEEPFMGGSVESVEPPGDPTTPVTRILVGGDWVQRDSGAPVVNDRNEFVGFVARVREGQLTVVRADDALKAFGLELLRENTLSEQAGKTAGDPERSPHPLFPIKVRVIVTANLRGSSFAPYRERLLKAAGPVGGQSTGPEFSEDSPLFPDPAQQAERAAYSRLSFPPQLWVSIVRNQTASRLPDNREADLRFMLKSTGSDPPITAGEKPVRLPKVDKKYSISEGVVSIRFPTETIDKPDHSTIVSDADILGALMHISMSPTFSLHSISLEFAGGREIRVSRDDLDTPETRDNERVYAFRLPTRWPSK